MADVADRPGDYRDCRGLLPSSRCCTALSPIYPGSDRSSSRDSDSVSDPVVRLALQRTGTPCNLEGVIFSRRESSRRRPEIYLCQYYPACIAVANVPRETEAAVNGLTIVTGGAGFVGSHLVRQLVQSGGLVRVLEKP